jgi:hypothetical protein
MTLTAPSSAVRDELRAYLALLAGHHPSRGEALELRYRLPTGGMARRFYPATRPHGLVEAITRLGARGDVYVGCAPRAHRAGGRDAIARSWVLWADCDTPEAAAALEAIDPPPTLVVASGSPAGRHSYWALRHPADLDAVEDLNRRLAHQLGSDQQVYDAARILRPPGTHNFKHHPPRPVRIVESRPERRITLDELREAWPPALEPSGKPPQLTSTSRRRDHDRLLQLAPAVYLPALTGHQVNADGKVPCPLHPDSTASLHAYSDHWFCFGCRRGGTVYDLAAPLFGLDTRGPDFLELRRRLLERFTGATLGR